jgi:cobalt-zinc-cadmium efflux system membrane fusion protein
LLSPLAGTVLQDNFIMGELIEPGRILFDISDESVLWVEARVTPSTLSTIKVGAQARVSANGTDWIEGTVIQLHHRLNETTRTQGVRIAVENTTDLLHPGQFAEAEITTGAAPPILAVPNESLTLIKGVPTVFRMEGGGAFYTEEVEVGRTIGNWTIILSGLRVGNSIAVSGVFHLKSLLLKSSLGEGHGH